MKLGSALYQVNQLFGTLKKFGDKKEEAEHYGIYSYKIANIYRDIWRACFDFAKKEFGVKDITKITGGMAKAFVEHKIASGINNATIIKNYCSAFVKMAIAIEKSTGDKTSIEDYKANFPDSSGDIDDIACMDNIIYCCNCENEVEAAVVSGETAYPHCPDLSDLLFFQCPTCKNFVGTDKENGKPFGSIAKPEIKKARMAIHNILDPIYKQKKMNRKQLYKILAERCGRKKIHAAWIRTMEEAKEVYRHILDIRKELGMSSPNSGEDFDEKNLPSFIVGKYWNGKIYGGNSVYLNNKEVKLTDTQLEEVEEYLKQTADPHKT